MRNEARTTIRLLDTLYRLATAHARLLLRYDVTETDAIVAIRLMESTFGFGHIIRSYDVIQQELPLGPDPIEIGYILKILNIRPKSPVQPAAAAAAVPDDNDDDDDETSNCAKAL